MTQTQASLPPADTAADGDASPSTLHKMRDRVLLFAGLVACYALCEYGAGRLGVLEYPGYGASLIEQSGWVGRLLAAAFLYVVAVAVGTLVTGVVRFDGGLLVGGLGLAALSMGSASSQSVYLWADSHGGRAVFLHLALEMVLLFLFVAAAWTAVWGLRGRGWLGDATDEVDEEPAPDPKAPRDPFARPKPKPTAAQMRNRFIMALALNVIVTSLIVLLLATDEAKGQVLAAVGIAAMFGAAAAQHFFPDADSREYHWVGALAAGLIGYLAAYLAAPDLATGHPGDSALAALARPLPLDYASFGTAGAVLGRTHGMAILRMFGEMVRKS